LTLPISTPEARTNWPSPQPAAIAELRGVAVGPVEAHLTEHHDDHHGEQQHQRDDAEFDAVPVSFMG
jgi:hypothetical protein